MFFQIASTNANTINFQNNLVYFYHFRFKYEYSRNLSPEVKKFGMWRLLQKVKTYPEDHSSFSDFNSET